MIVLYLFNEFNNFFFKMKIYNIGSELIIIIKNIIMKLVIYREWYYMWKDWIFFGNVGRFCFVYVIK